MGKLEIISILCDVTTQLADLVERMTLEMEQAQIAESVMQDFNNQKEECQRQMDIAEYKLRRCQHGGD